MEVIAHARHIRMSPRKVRLVAGLVRGMDVDRAAAQLRFYSKAAARPIAKLLQSAVANASHNFKMSTDGLYIKAITVDQGPTLKRFRARAFGRAAGIKKKSSHISIVLAAREGAAPSGVDAAVVVPAEAGTQASKGKTEKVAAKKTVKKSAAKPAAKKKA